MPDRGIGKGLSALLDERRTKEADLREVPSDLIRPNPRQPRQKIDEGELLKLSESISERGVLQPIIVRELADGKYELIAGERRWKAAMKAGLEKIPSVVHGNSFGDGESGSLEMALIENVVREDLNPIEQARACSALIDELGLKVEEVGRRIGRSRSGVSNLIRLLELPDEVIGTITDGRLSEGHGRAILQEKDQRRRRKVAAEAVERGLSVRQTEALARGDDVKSRPAGAGKAKLKLHPDLEQLKREAEDALSSALGVEVKVKVRGRGAKVEFVLDDLRDALRIARRGSLKRAA